MKFLRKFRFYIVIYLTILLSSCAKFIPYESPLYSYKNKMDIYPYDIYNQFTHESFYSMQYGAAYDVFNFEMCNYGFYSNNLPYSNPRFYYPEYFLNK